MARTVHVSVQADRVPARKVGLLLAVGLGLWLVGFGARLVSHTDVYNAVPYADGGQISLYGVDPPFHIRRIALTMRAFPQVPYHDMYLAYPSGSWSAYWPPLFDWVLAAAAKGLGCSPDDTEGLIRLTLFVPPLLGAFTVLVVWLIARQVMGAGAALGAALLFAVFPGHVFYSLLGRLDHHVAEALVCLLMILFLLAGLRRVEAGKGALVAAAGCGAMMACSLTISLGSSMPIALVAAFLPLKVFEQVAATRRAESSAPLLRFGAVAFSAALVLLIPFCLHPPQVGARQETYVGLSWSYLYLVGAPALLFLIVERACGLGWLQRKPHLAAPAVFAAASLALLAVPALAYPPLLKPLLMAAGYVTQSDPWTQAVSETQSLLFSGGFYRPAFAEVLLSRFIFLYPLIVLALLIARWRYGQRSWAYDFFLFWSLLMVPLAFGKKRFVYFAAVNLSLALAYSAAWFVKWLNGGPAGRTRHPVVRAAGLTGLAACFAFAFQPSLNFYWPLCDKWKVGGVPFYTAPAAVREAFAWMRDYTPATSYYCFPGRRPEYGAICTPDYGVWAVFYARRPVVTGPTFCFQDDDRERTAEVCRFLLAEEEAEANEICDRNQARYALTVPLLFQMQNFARIAGLDPDQYLVLTNNAETGEPLYRVTDRYWRLVGLRLHEGDGMALPPPPEWADATAPDPPPALQRYRLLYESAEFTDFASGHPAVLKIFEYVPGAKLTGQTLPDAAVRVEVDVLTNRGRKFTYRAATTAGPRGEFALVVPYASNESAAQTRAVSAYRVNALGMEVPAEAAEADVLGGREVKVVFPRVPRP